jgi:hypothetical protein
MTGRTGGCGNAFADAAEFWIGCGFDTVLIHAPMAGCFRSFCLLFPTTVLTSSEAVWRSHAFSADDAQAYPRQDRAGQGCSVTSQRLRARPLTVLRLMILIEFLSNAQEFLDMGEISLKTSCGFSAHHIAHGA